MGGETNKNEMNANELRTYSNSNKVYGEPKNYSRTF